MRVLLVAGHGAGDPGACGNGYQEAVLARELVDMIKTRMGNSADVFDKNKNMYRFLKNGGCFDFSGYDAILEIHFNAGAKKGTDNAVTGCEMLIRSGTAEKAFDKSITEGMAKIGIKSRGIKKRDNLYNMNYLYKKGMPYSLFEVCFIDDADDMAMYLKNKQKIAELIVQSFGAKKELESVNDIVWELAERGIIADKSLWLKKLELDKNAYWLARKCVSYIKNTR